MRTVLQDILRQQCYQTGWCYAVFWKLKRLGRMMLTWEDGYCKFAKPSMISTPASMMPALFLDGFNFGGIDDTTPGQDVYTFEDKIGLAVAKMSYQVFSLGEGIIGHVAYTGKHQWILVENNGNGLGNAPGGFNNHLLLEAGWQNQFAAGIKTIALIGVLPHGVVQLGSTHLMFHKEDSFLARDDLKGGASWALELGSQMIRCPVIVENLDQPHQILIEMLCEEQELFLEIADTLRGLGLIILNSFMESRHLKMWANFVVETNRNAQLHRLEVLWSLMHLLQPHAINYSNETCQPVQIESQQFSSSHTIPEFAFS